MKPPSREIASSGHLLGQLIGDWWERYVVKPLLDEVAAKLQLFADCRFVSRSCRREKIQWTDADGNIVDYDFVLELGGSPDERGSPVAFMESFWRRGARHSKDKARDDTNKLLPMMHTYPSARFLAIAACGEFTEPAREYVRSRGVTLFFVTKSNIVAAFQKAGVDIDYPDSLPEESKKLIAFAAQQKMTPDVCALIAENLKEIAGHGALTAFQHQIISALSAYPQEIRIRKSELSDPVLFHTAAEASEFLKAPEFQMNGAGSRFTYEVTYSDGSEFHRDVESLEHLIALHDQLLMLVNHMERLNDSLN